MTVDIEKYPEAYEENQSRLRDAEARCALLDEFGVQASVYHEAPFGRVYYTGGVELSAEQTDLLLSLLAGMQELIDDYRGTE